MVVLGQMIKIFVVPIQRMLVQERVCVRVAIPGQLADMNGKQVIGAGKIMIIIGFGLLE